MGDDWVHTRGCGHPAGLQPRRLPLRRAERGARARRPAADRPLGLPEASAHDKRHGGALPASSHEQKSSSATKPSVLPRGLPRVSRGPARPRRRRQRATARRSSPRRQADAAEPDERVVGGQQVQAESRRGRRRAAAGHARPGSPRDRVGRRLPVEVVHQRDVGRRPHPSGVVRRRRRRAMRGPSAGRHRGRSSGPRAGSASTALTWPIQSRMRIRIAISVSTKPRPPRPRITAGSVSGDVGGGVPDRRPAAAVASAVGRRRSATR